ncbi:MAG TPA: proline dehydrogenase family protein [Clostridia bacterium]|nr:proline dehydrogenase family protein [Clostridia bacterium]
MSTALSARAGRKEAALRSDNLEAAVQEWGEKIIGLADAAGTPALFTRKGLQGALMDWALRDERFKTQLFRFVDVLPALNSSAEVSRHLKEYLDHEQAGLPASLRAALKAATGASWLVGPGVTAQVTGLARTFMVGNDDEEIVAALRRLQDQQIGFTVDVLGEAVVSETEAGAYAQRYLGLLQMLARAVKNWPGDPAAGSPPAAPAPVLNLSVKISALYSQIHPADPDTAIETITARLRPILELARQTGALINFDMEHYALKNLTLLLFQQIFAAPEFHSGPACGLAIQAYLKDSAADLQNLIAWARAHRRPVTIRLVKGAYWDYETVMARQRGWPVPVFESKAQTDANFEQLSVLLLENAEFVDAALGTHNVRSIAHALAQAERLGVGRRGLEFQMLRGMAEPIKAALVRLDCRVREYCPVGELLPGMAYFVRRLLENTSNEGFLANQYARGVRRTDLLTNPQDRVQVRPESAQAATVSAFQNEPPADFTIPAQRDRLRDALRELRGNLGGRYPLLINNRAVSTRDWLPSLNPANQNEIIGLAAQATVAEADAALAAARAAQPPWGRTPPEARAALLEKAAALMRRDKASLCALEILEAGKSWTEADADVAEAIDFCNFYAAEMRRIAPGQLTQRVPGESNVEHWWPRGVGVVIAPWNFPLAILTGMSAAAIVAGNAVILKPSDQTPVIASRWVELLIEAGLPPAVANLVTGPGSSVGAHLVSHPQVDFIAFTGSKEVGLKIWETAGRTLAGQGQLKKVVCEMGGKNCVIVDSDADLDEAVTGCLASAFNYQGQKCSALSRLIVLEHHYDRFLERFVAAASSLRAGPAEIPGTSIGPVISREAQHRILALIQADHGEAQLLWQGTVPDDPAACYVPATIFANVPRSSRLFREEIFGPVLAVTRARDLPEALSLANDSEFALTGGLYSRSPANIARVKSEMVCGNLYINRPITGAVVERQPFGGFRMSGGGTKAGGREYLQNFLVPRVVTENRIRRGFAAED